MNGTPFLVTAPTVAPVSILDVQNHLRITGNFEDEVIEALILAQTAYLDGWSGVLGRAIMPQTWAQVWTGGAQACLIAMPDVSEIVVKLDGVTLESTAYTVERTAKGQEVTLDGVSGDEIRVEYTCGMPAAKLAQARLLICLMVGDAFENRTGGSGAQAAINAQIAALRWGGV